MNTIPAYQLDAHQWFLAETVAHESPLEPGVFHLPAGCVEVAPPAAAEGQRARWTGAAWVLEAWQPPAPPDPVSVLAAFLDAHPEVAALVSPKAPA